MDSWHAPFLGLRHLPREITAFELEAFFQFSAAERRVIDERRRPELKLGLALQIGFLRMSGRLLEAVRMVPPLLWRHLGEQFGVAAPDLASLRAMYRRAPTLIEHQQQACEALGFRWLSEHQCRALVSALREELVRTDDRQRLLGFARRWLYEHRLLIVRGTPLKALHWPLPHFQWLLDASCRRSHRRAAIAKNRRDRASSHRSRIPHRTRLPSESSC
jgi:Domain of unknown function (DUF4158)